MDTAHIFVCKYNQNDGLSHRNIFGVDLNGKVSNSSAAILFIITLRVYVQYIFL